MKMSANGRALLIQREGFKLKAYQDSVGVWTIGVGHTSMAGPPHVSPGLAISKAEVDAILSRDLVKYENIVTRAIHVPLTQGQFDALVSICFNVESALSSRSSIVRALNSGNYRAAGDAFLLYNHPSEIIGRRKGERKQFLSATNGSAGKPVRYMPASDLHEDEKVTPDYLRAAGSRTIKAADSIKKTAATIGVGDMLATASQIKDYANQANDIATGFQHGAPARELLDNYWPIFLGVGATMIVALLAFLIWTYARQIVKARVDDAVFTPGE